MMKDLIVDEVVLLRAGLRDRVRLIERDVTKKTMGLRLGLGLDTLGRRAVYSQPS